MARTCGNIPRATGAIAREKLGCRRGLPRSTLKHRPWVQSCPLGFLCFILKDIFPEHLIVAQDVLNVCQVYQHTPIIPGLGRMVCDTVNF